MVALVDPLMNDLALVDGQEPVRFTSRIQGIYRDVMAVRFAVTIKEMVASNGRLTSSDTVFHVSAADLPIESKLLRPTPGDAIVDEDGELWTILESVSTCMGSRIRCICRNLAITEGLDTLVTIQQATYTKDAAGAQETLWSDWRPGLRAKIQMDSADEEVLHERRRLKRVGKVLIRETIPVTANHRVIGADGSIYRVTGFEAPDRFDRCFEIRIEQLTVPTA